MAKSRNYAKRTLQILFGLSGNQCAAPGCTSPIIAPATEKSDEAIIGQIAHIYAHSDKGPRGNPDMPESERDLPPNLLLLCGVHHPLVDKQEETYPADMLLEWKREHEAKFSPETVEAIKREADFSRHAYYVRMSDQDIEAALDKLRQARVLEEYPTLDEAKRLAETIDAQELAGGSKDTRARSLAWCARIISGGGSMDQAKAILAKSRQLAKTDDADIAEAFLLAPADRPAAMAILAAVGTPAANGAALRIVLRGDDAPAALAWAANAGVDEQNLDADGKHAYMFAALTAHDWNLLSRVASSLTAADFDQAVGLVQLAAMSNMLQAVVAPDLRPILLQGVPFQPADFPLSYDPDAMTKRQQAIALFRRMEEYCQSIGLPGASAAASDYALWLELRDPAIKDNAMARLRVSMRNPDEQLRRINLALKFGIALDIGAIEQRLDQSVQFTGSGTMDDALARFTLVFAQPTAQDRARYFARHRDQLYKHLTKLGLLIAEVQLLGYAGQISTARERLKEAETEGLDSKQVAGLQRMLAEIEGSDPVAMRRAQYEATGDLESLRNLTDAMRQKAMWDDLLPLAQRLFDKTHDIDDCVLVAHTLNELDLYGDLHAFLLANHAIVDQDTNLKAMWAWSLWREGKFASAAQALDALSTFKNTASHRGLRVNIAISSGNWSALSTYCDEVYDDRDNTPAEQLLHAGQLAQAVGNPHAADLVRTAAAKAPDDPAILANAYSQAASGGWEGSAAVAGWIQTAAAKSGADGPIQTMTLKELTDRKPVWDKQLSDVAEQLNVGRIPAFMAAAVLNRSFMELTLLPSMANPAEADARKRAIVYAFSGARQPVAIGRGSTLAVELGALFTLARLGLLDLVFARFKIIIPHSTLGWLFQERGKAIFHQPSRMRDAKLLKQLINSGAIKVLAKGPASNERLAQDIGWDLADMLAAAEKNTAAGAPAVVVRSPPVYRLGSLMEEVADMDAWSGVLVSCGAVLNVMKAKAALTVAEESRARAFLQTQEAPWPNEPAVTADTAFYLDDLSISHLKAAGVLAKIKTAGLKVFVTEDANNDADQFSAMESQSADQLDIIEQIRAKLASGLANGKVQAVRATRAEEDQEFKSHPSYTILQLSEPADALLIDDRFLNQHPHMTYGDRTTPIVCCLDILAHLRGEGVISEEEYRGYRTQLRRFGYQFIPVEEEELRAHLAAATVVAGALVETAELKAIRESLLRARMVRMVQMPLELPAMQRTYVSFMRLVREVWVTSPTEEEAIARGDWILNVSDPRGWASLAQKGLERNWAIYEFAQYALQISGAPVSANLALRERYFAWITSRILNEVEQTQPEVFDWLVARVKELMVSGVEDAMKEKP